MLVASTSARVHGHFLAGEAGEIAGVSGNTIGQWARHGDIRASQSAEEPHVYSVEDVAQAAVVRALLPRGVRPRDGRPAIARPGPPRAGAPSPGPPPPQR